MAKADFSGTWKLDAAKSSGLPPFNNAELFMGLA
jgi:hypothetical protein